MSQLYPPRICDDLQAAAEKGVGFSVVLDAIEFNATSKEAGAAPAPATPSTNPTLMKIFGTWPVVRQIVNCLPAVDRHRGVFPALRSAVEKALNPQG